MKNLNLLLLACILLALPVQALPQKPHERIEDVVYGRKYATALTMDVWKPKNANGVGIIFIMSGGWQSSKETHTSVPWKQWYPDLVDAGFTVFTLVHGSQPHYAMPEIFSDLHRGIRFVRANASKYGVDPQRLGLMGGSAGGHLTLTMATQGKEGNPQSKDPVERESSRVQAAMAFFPPTDFLNYNQPGDDAVGVGTLKGFKAAFGSRSDTAESRQVYGKEISPINFVTKDLPPTLLIHGDADKLVPIYQAEIFEKKAREAGAEIKLIRRPGLAHGWPNYSEDMKEAVAWFQKTLVNK